jgi:hypothetical protein
VLSSPFDGNFQSSRNFSQIYAWFELVDVHQNGIWFKLVNVDKKYSIVGETILYFIRTKPSFFELSSVFFSTLWKPNNYAPIEKVLILWFCWTYNIVLHSLLHVQSTASSRVSSKCSNSTMQSYILKLHVCLSVRAVSKHCPDLCFFFFLDGFCFLCQLNYPDLCFFLFFFMGFVFCVS